jgi:hypothetical protein
MSSGKRQIYMISKWARDTERSKQPLHLISNELTSEQSEYLTVEPLLLSRIHSTLPRGPVRHFSYFKDAKDIYGSSSMIYPWYVSSYIPSD